MTTVRFLIAGDASELGAFDAIFQPAATSDLRSMIWLLLVVLGLLAYGWIAYPILMATVAACRRPTTPPPPSEQPLVTVIIAAHNEADHLEARLENILDSAWPYESIEVLIVSDGSTDHTGDVARRRAAADRRVRLLEVRPQRGRANAHNVGCSDAAGEIVVFTDAETTFDPGFISAITRPFADSRVGFASGALAYTNEDDGAAKSAGLYWRQEQALRRAESACGMFAFGSGACCAVRKNLFREIPPTGDIDFTTPLDVVLQGYRCVHCPDAVAYDVLPDSVAREFRSRIRMTSKNLRGTVARWGLRGLWSHPVYSLVIVSHKVLKWITPVLGLVLMVSAATLAAESMIAWCILGGQLAFLVLAAIGSVFPRVPGAAHAWHFLMVNAAFGVGVCKAVFGAVPSAYRPVSQTSR